MERVPLLSHPGQPSDDVAPWDSGSNPRASTRRSRYEHDAEDNRVRSTADLQASFMRRPDDEDGGCASLSQAMVHIFKGNVGAGVFLLPAFYQEAGFLLGALMVAALGSIMIDCCEQLLRAKYAIDSPEVHSYPAVVKFVLGDRMAQFTKFALTFTQLGFCAIYVQYAAAMFAELFDAPYLYEAFVAINVVVVTPMTFLSNRMDLLAYASLVAAVFVIVVLFGTTSMSIDSLLEQGPSASVRPWIPSTRLIVFLSGHMFSLEGIGIVLPVENSVAPEDREGFRKVVRHTLTFIVMMYIAVGVLGYVSYGSSLTTSVVLALPPGLIKVVLQVMLGVSLIFGYPIQYVPAIEIIDTALGVSLEASRWKAMAVRLALNVSFGVLALLIGADTLNTFASFLGAFVGVHLMITLPTLLVLQLDNALSLENRDEMGYGAYLLQMFKGPLDMDRIYRYSCLLLAALVWVGGIYFTCVSVLV